MSADTVEIPRFNVARGTAMRRSGSTERFFLEGEEQEANGFENVVLEDDTGIDSRQFEFESFDRIPRRRRPLLIVAGLSTVLGVALMIWMVGFPTKRPLPEGVLASSVRLDPAPIPAVALKAATPPEQPVPDRAPPSLAAPIENPTVRETLPKGNPIDRAPVRAPSRTGSEIAAKVDLPAPLRGHVWSPTTGTMVPAELIPAAAAVTPGGTPIESFDRSSSEPTPILD